MAKGNINEDTTFEAMERGRLFRKFLSDYYNYKAQTGNPVFALKLVLGEADTLISRGKLIAAEWEGIPNIKAELYSEALYNSGNFDKLSSSTETGRDAVASVMTRLKGYVVLSKIQVAEIQKFIEQSRKGN